ncbi:hypothetical protein M011DRAFT_426994 [Sporormia fimetaria CBS 119925]|uniref:Leo1-domain-containing protein n=1 Tax=Sporormia fimetaria CBS 119925 TaxID=1340428 RepID=A0A6A6V7C0_9PLEO|nr:hypothetical protein M011DRAFT_426994 [Sporormia fimetaria CBS 119925]
MAANSTPPHDVSDNEEHGGSLGLGAGDDAEGGADVRGTVEEPELDDEDGDDLFGDGGDDEEEPPSMRKLDDADLDSGDDEGRTDRVPHTQHAAEEAEEQTQTLMDADIARHPIPEPSDGELYRLKVPSFMSFEPNVFNAKTFQPPTTEHHSRESADDAFSAYETAMTTIRWRRSPSNPQELQSNARILRWSDGSLTMQLATQPLIQYQLNAQPLAPPQVNPKKPTPLSVKQKTQAQGKESYTYLAAPYEVAQVMRITSKFTTGLDVVPPPKAKDAALEKLQNAFAKKQNSGSTIENTSLVTTVEDPELARQQAELAFKQKQKALRAKQKQDERDKDRQLNIKVGGGRATGHGGLSVNDLEDDDGGRRGGIRKQGARKTGLRRDWSDDEDYGNRARNREDEYDEEDDFIAASDEEPEIVDDEDEEESIMDSPPRRRQETQSPKRSFGGDDEDVVVSRTKRRRVVEDDDDEDE